LSTAAVGLDTWSDATESELAYRHEVSPSPSFTMVEFDGVIVVFSHSFSGNTQSRPEVRVSAVQRSFLDPSDSNLDIDVFQLIPRSSKHQAQGIACSRTREKNCNQRNMYSSEPRPTAYTRIALDQPTSSSHNRVGGYSRKIDNISVLPLHVWH
jgi:hypothetical protein